MSSTKENSVSDGLSFREKAGYALGDTASHFVWDMVGVWLLVFYTDVFGLDPSAAALIMLIARLWDMVTDPIMGVIADRTSTRWGKFRPYLLWMAVPYGALAVAAFSTPDLGPMGKAIYAGATYMLLMTVYTVINLPYSSLAGVMTQDGNERASINQYRFIFAFAGQLVVTGSALTLVDYFGQGDKARGYQTTTAIFGALAVVFFVITFLSTKERVHPPAEQKTDLRQDIKNLINTGPWIVLFGVGICSFTLFAMQGSVTAYYFEYFIGDADWSFAWPWPLAGLKEAERFNIVGSFALIAAIPLAKPLAKRFGNRNVFIVCSLLTGVWYAAMFFPRPDQLWLIYLLNILGKVSYAPTVPLLWTMIANTADYSEWKTGRRATGLFFSAATLSMKLGWGIGGALAAFLLGQFGYVANQAQSATSLLGIKLMFTVFPAALYFLASILLVFYELTLETVTRMQAELAARRARDEANTLQLEPS